MMETLPIVDVACLAPVVEVLLQSKATNACLSISSELLNDWVNGPQKQRIVEAANNIRTCFCQMGFMYIKNYPIPEWLEDGLDSVAREFFRLPLPVKERISMEKGGVAWRGFFPVGGELTSGKPDLKEGLYFGQERDENDDRVRQGTPLFGKNLFLDSPPQMRELVLKYMDHCEAIGQGLLFLIALSLKLPVDYFIRGFCKDPTCLFRIFHYPPPATLADERLRSDSSLWGVGEHTDYGLITLLKQDMVGGLEVRRVDGLWIKAPPVRRTLVVNIGDMMEAMTGGLFTSNPHRVRNLGGPDAMRLSFPFFFDPGFHSNVSVLPLSQGLQQMAAASLQRRTNEGMARWDTGAVTVSVSGTYGQYLMRKVGKVFPGLAETNQLPSKM